MLHRVAACLLIVALGLASSLSQTVKKDEGKETKPAITTPTQGTKKPTSPRTMKFVSCSQPGCGFWAKSPSAKELRYIMKRHAKRYHKTSLSLDQLKEMVKKHETK